jgi:hypothetical protein
MASLARRFHPGLAWSGSAYGATGQLPKRCIAKSNTRHAKTLPRLHQNACFDVLSSGFSAFYLFPRAGTVHAIYPASPEKSSPTNEVKLPLGELP